MKKFKIFTLVLLLSVSFFNCKKDTSTWVIVKLGGCLTGPDSVMEKVRTDIKDNNKAANEFCKRFGREKALDARCEKENLEVKCE